MLHASILLCSNLQDFLLLTHRLVAGTGVICRGPGLVRRHIALAFRCAGAPVPPQVVCSTQRHH